MIELGIRKVEVNNCRTLVYDVKSADEISVWFIEADGVTRNPWWDLEISPAKAKWLVDQWNKGNVIKECWWIEDWTRDITSLLDLNENELRECLNFCANVWPHHRWTTELELDRNIRPVWQWGKIIGFVEADFKEYIRHNVSEKKKGYNMILYGKTDTEYIREALEDY